MSERKNIKLPKPESGSKHRIAKTATFAALFFTAVYAASAASHGVNFSGQISADAAAVLSPLSEQMISFTDSAALRLRSANTSGETVHLALKAYDTKSNPLDMEIWSGESIIRPGEATMTTVVFHLGNAGSMRLKICAEQTASSGLLIGRACGHYRVERRILDN